MPWLPHELYVTCIPLSAYQRYPVLFGYQERAGYIHLSSHGGHHLLAILSARACFLGRVAVTFWHIFSNFSSFLSLFHSCLVFFLSFRLLHHLLSVLVHNEVHAVHSELTVLFVISMFRILIAFIDLFFTSSPCFLGCNDDVHDYMYSNSRHFVISMFGLSLVALIDLFTVQSLILLYDVGGCDAASGHSPSWLKILSMGKRNRKGGHMVRPIQVSWHSTTKRRWEAKRKVEGTYSY